MLNLVIIEDDIQTTEFILDIIGSSCPDVKIRGVANELYAAKRMISELSPELVLFDIDFLGETSFDIIKELKITNFKIIFISSHDKYAFKAIKLGALDYLLKPVDPKELVKAIEKAQKMIHGRDIQFQLNPLSSNVHYKINDLEKIVIRTAESIFLLNIKDIIRCESGGSYTFIHLTNGKKITTSRLLKDFDELLQNHGFMRTHQSHLININYIDRFERRNGGALIMNDGTGVPVSFRKKESFFKLIEEL